MIPRNTEISPRLKARIAGLLYLLVIAGGVFAVVFVRDRLIVHGDPAATAANIVAQEMRYRLGFAVEVFYCACNVPLVLIFYDLFKVVNKSVAFLMVFFGLIGTAIEGVSLLGHIAPLILLGSGQHLGAFTPEQLQAASYVSLGLFERGFAIAAVFLGAYFICFGYLILKSTFFARFIGMLLAIEGLCYLINSFGIFLSSTFDAHFFPFLMLSSLAEVLLCVWLLVAGVNVERWQEQHSATAGSGS